MLFFIALVSLLTFTQSLSEFCEFGYVDAEPSSISRIRGFFHNEGIMTFGKFPHHISFLSDNGDIESSFGISSEVFGIVEVTGGFVACESSNCFKFDTDGNIIWERAYDRPSATNGWSIKNANPMEDGNFILLGNSVNPYYATIAKISSLNGDVMWVRHFQGATNCQVDGGGLQWNSIEEANGQMYLTSYNCPEIRGFNTDGTIEFSISCNLYNVVMGSCSDGVYISHRSGSEDDVILKYSHSGNFINGKQFYDDGTLIVRMLYPPVFELNDGSIIVPGYHWSTSPLAGYVYIMKFSDYDSNTLDWAVKISTDRESVLYHEDTKGSVNGTFFVSLRKTDIQATTDTYYVIHLDSEGKSSFPFPFSVENVEITVTSFSDPSFTSISNGYQTDVLTSTPTTQFSMSPISVNYGLTYLKCSDKEGFCGGVQCNGDCCSGLYTDDTLQDAFLSTDGIVSRTYGEVMFYTWDKSLTSYSISGFSGYLIVEVNGGYIICGKQMTVCLKVEINGNKLWEITFNKPSHTLQIKTLMSQHDGNFVVTLNDNSNDLTVVKVSSQNGDVIWYRHFANSGAFVVSSTNWKSLFEAKDEPMHVTRAGYIRAISPNGNVEFAMSGHQLVVDVLGSDSEGSYYYYSGSIFKYSPSGSFINGKDFYYNGDHIDYDGITVIETKDGKTLVSIVGTPNGPSVFFLFKFSDYDSEILEWANMYYDPEGNMYSFLNSINEDSDGNLLLTFSLLTDLGMGDFVDTHFIALFDSNGGTRGTNYPVTRVDVTSLITFQSVSEPSSTTISNDYTSETFTTTLTNSYTLTPTTLEMFPFNDFCHETPCQKNPCGSTCDKCSPECQAIDFCACSANLCNDLCDPCNTTCDPCGQTCDKCSLDCQAIDFCACSANLCNVLCDPCNTSCDPCGQTCNKCSPECQAIDFCACSANLCNDLCDPCNTTCDPCGQTCNKCSSDCMEINHCLCDNTLEGCSGQIFCWNAYNWNPAVCSGHGVCQSINNCKCDANYYGNKCQHFKCNGIDHLSDSVCSGFGKCVDHDTCLCNNGFSSVTPGLCDICDSSNCGGTGTCIVDGTSSISCSSCGTGVSGSICDVCTVGGNVGVHMDGSCYYSFSGVRLDWQGSRDYCKVNFHAASDLAVIPNERAQFAFRKATKRKKSWILLSDGENQNTWEWKDGVTSLDYTLWNKKSPDNGGDCAYIHDRLGVWMNYHCMNHVSMSSVTCSLNMIDLGLTYSSNPLLNVGWKKYDFSSGWCDWTVASNCDDKYQKCNGIKHDDTRVCHGSNGTCTFNAVKKDNYCVCNAGREGIDCELEDVPISGLDCDAVNGYCYRLFDVKLKWNDAREYCKANWDPAADLAVVYGSIEQELISGIVGTNNVWIGALDFVEGITEWIDHRPMNYNKFILKDDGGTFGEDCVEMKSNYEPYRNQWATSNCAIQKKFVCGLKISDAGGSWSSEGWVNVEYSKLNTNQAACKCDGRGGGPCPSCGCENPCP